MTEGTRILASLGGVVLFLIAGTALTDLVPELRRLPPWRRMGFSYLLGIALVGSMLYASSYVAGIPIRRGPILVAVLLPIAAAVLRRFLAHSDRRTRHLHEPRAPRWLVALAAAVGAFVSFSVLAEALTNPVDDWDGRMIWCTRARHIRAERTVSPRVLAEERWSVSLPRYPVLMPLAQVIVQEVFDSPAEDDRVFRPVYAAFLPAMLLVLLGAGSRLAGPRAAAVAVGLASLLPFLSLARNGGASGCHSDLAVGCFWGAGLLLLLLPRVTVPAGLASGVLLSAAVLTKNEGLFLSLFALAAALTHALRSRRSARPALAAAVFVGLAAGLLFSWRSDIAHLPEKDYLGLFGVRAVFLGLRTNASSIAANVLGVMTERRSWGIFFWALPVVLLLGARAFRRRAALPLLLALGGAVTMYLAAYALTVQDLPELVKVTWNRFLVQMSLPLLTLFALVVREALRSRTRPTPQAMVASSYR